MKKRIFIVLLTLCLVIAAMTVTATAIITGQYWILDDSGGLTVFNDFGMSDWQENGKDGSFNYVGTVKSVLIADGVTVIPSYAFVWCTDLTDVSIPNSITKIDYAAFANCSSLTSINIPSSVTSIDSQAFIGTNIDSVTLSCAATYNNDSFPSTTKITLTHTYVNSVCFVCNAVEPDHVYIGSLKLYDGYYTVDGVSAVYGTPDSTVTSYAYYSSGVLYLNNFTYTATSGTYGVYSENDSLTIDLCGGTSSLSGVTGGIYAVGDLTVTNGSLVVSAEYGIVVTNGDVVISDCTSVTVLATGSYGIIARNYNDSDHSITISDSTVNVTATTANGGSMAGIVATGDVNISGSTVSVTVDCEEVMGAIWSVGGNISITDKSTVTAKATAETYSVGAINAMLSETGNITISKSEVTASSVCTNSTAVNYGAICTEGNISIMDSTVTAGATSTIASGGAITSFGDSGSITISNSEITASSVCTSTVYETTNCGAIYTKGDISIIKSSAVTASANGGLLSLTADMFGVGILSSNGSVLVSASDIEVTIDSSSNFYSQYDFDLAYGIAAIKDIVIEEDSNIKIDISGSYAMGIGTEGDLTISESNINVEADGDSSCGIYGTDIISITASEVVADGGFYLTSSTGTVTVTPAADGALKITRTNDNGSDISVINEATVIDTDGYTYVAITVHEHVYDCDNIVWEWAEDYSSATATVACKSTDHSHEDTFTAAITISTGSGRETVYTATITIAGTEYTSTQTVAAASSKLDTLKRIQANYSAVTAAIAKANSLNPSDYVDFSSVTAAVNAVNWNLNTLNQSQVNAYAEAIETAIANLVPINTEEVEIDEPIEAGVTETEQD